MKKLCICIFLVLCCLVTRSQSKIDSTLSIFQDETKSDTNRLGAIDDFIIANYYTLSPDSLFIVSKLQVDFAEKKDKKKFLANGLFFQGLSQQFKGNNKDAINYFLRGLEIMEDIGDKKGVSAQMQRIGSIYQDQGVFSKAIKYYEKAYRIDVELGDKVGISNYFSYLGSVNSAVGNCEKALEYHKKSLAISEELNDQSNISASLTNIGNAYDCQKKYSEALTYYLKSLKIDEEMGDALGVSISLNNIGNNYEETNDYIKALEYYKKGLNVSKGNQQTAIYPQLLSNIGNIYVKVGSVQKGIIECEKSLKIAEAINNLSAQQNSCECLYDAYKASGNNKKALEFFERSKILIDSIKSQDNIKTMQNLEFAKQMEIDSLAQVTKDTEVELAHQTEVQKKDKNKNIAIAAGIFFLFLSGGLYSRWRYTKRSKAIIEKEKNRSENLLLNILPAEIAQELKEKGKADARDFEMVSILFSDFKGFTEISEKMNAKDLVANINVCFEAFDNIMQKFNIEKIKTIGDAYMAAGGLPVNTKDSVKRTVLAALEMQEFIMNLHREKEQIGEHAFEMRVGIHTGPVVAGIVGVKKFQYDIWGDTVNTASRIESNGEVGKVNISEDTFNAIKNEPEFYFESRGKIEAKGKGEIEMYFVFKK